MTKRKRDAVIDEVLGDQGDSTDGPLPEMVGGNTEGTTADEEQSDEPSYVKIENVKLDDVLVVMGDEYDCLHDGEEKEVKQNEHGRLYVDCEEGRHWLDKTDIHDYVIGLGVKEKKVA